jgi:pilus assembly protein CpaE
MPRVLAIDDDPIVLKIVASALAPLGYEVITAPDGEQGLRLAATARPDAIICDVMMPGMDGYEVTRHLRRDPACASIPILILTAQSQLDEKIRAFEAGADDHMVKPFDPAELTARLGVLLRRLRAVKGAPTPELPAGDEARVIALHSLRGGVGCSSLAINLALALAGLWDGQTLLMDLVSTSGQAALMLNMPLRRTWADIVPIQPDDLDWEALHTVIVQHPSGLHLLAAPTYPTQSESLTTPHVNALFRLLRPRYDYIVADLSHDFSDVVIQTLDTAEIIMLPLAPDLASVRAAVAALDTYTKLGYSPAKFQIVLNSIFERQGFGRRDIETALHAPVGLSVPFGSDRFVSAINRGSPLVYTHPEDPISALLEDQAFRLSKERHQTATPAAPKPGWQRVKKRQMASSQRK